MLVPSESKHNDAGMSFAAILAKVSPCLDALNVFLNQQVDVFEPEVQDMVRYCLQHQGKRIRPMLLFFSGWKEETPVQEDLVRAAAVIELVHLATLVHDDILDEADTRHNSETISAKYGATVAVLLGDALFSHALHLATDFQTVEVCRAVSLSPRRVCAGEIRQTFERGNSHFPLEEYFRVIDLKTAELFRVACELGAKLGGYDEGYVRAVAEYGRRLGIAYQIFDDAADFLGDEAKIGKTLGTDLESGKYTLPLLLLLEKVPAEEATALVDSMAAGNADLKAISARMEETGVFSMVAARFAEEVAEAEERIGAFANLAPTPYLLQLSSYVKQQMAKLNIA